jgi:hypothetical protein
MVKERVGGGRRTRMKRKRKLLPDALGLKKVDDALLTAQVLKCRMV